ncbi:hypothetical protein SAMN05880501_104247 [Ureibacillus xyleni]|uniref:Preprotein translocase subunit Tim44 n=1 Tax=Ureibacillus xyleni TaxID=614648 RepID=A0A285SEL1_9BACL|nr:hypothetical protein [Ureibacillus xyleni]SOC06327.1 hypothetical protein SAMN05880501_104247 [Ureibacillus xyleni]
MKIVSAILLAFTLAFTSVGTVILQDDVQTVEAKKYKSGKKSYNSNPGTNNNNIKDNDAGTNVNKATTTNKNTTGTATTAKKGGFFSGGLMRGLFIGGLAGLLFGSLFADMGLLGNILGFAINAAAIIFIVFLCMKIYQMMKRKKDKEVTDHWRN